MPDPIWPVTLPTSLLVAGYSESPPNTAIRSSVDAGPAKIRQRFTAGPRPISGRLILTADQLDDLDDFYVTDTAGGSLQWTASIDRVGTSASYRFTAPPRYGQPEGPDAWPVELALEILP